ncbi:MAG: hypothetical protein WCI37_02295 [bacterium]
MPNNIPKVKDIAENGAVIPGAKSPPVRSVTDIVQQPVTSASNTDLQSKITSTGFSIIACIPGTDAIIVYKSGTGFTRNKISSNDLLLMKDYSELNIFQNVI